MLNVASILLYDGFHSLHIHVHTLVVAKLHVMMFSVRKERLKTVASELHRKFGQNVDHIKAELLSYF